MNRNPVGKPWRFRVKIVPWQFLRIWSKLSKRPHMFIKIIRQNFFKAPKTKYYLGISCPVNVTKLHEFVKIHLNKKSTMTYQKKSVIKVSKFLALSGVQILDGWFNTNLFFVSNFPQNRNINVGCRLTSSHPETRTSPHTQKPIWKH
jgi:hypothetical protein